MNDATKHLFTLVPLGQVATRPWLMAHGASRHTIDNWVKSGQLQAVVRGVFKRPGTELTWQGVVCSLQAMASSLSPGGLTALTLQGMAHYISTSEQEKIHLYGRDSLPSWANKLLPEASFIHHRGLDMDTEQRVPVPSFASVPFTAEFSPPGFARQPMRISTPEMALLEVLLDVPQRISFEHASQLLQGMPTLSPQRLTQLLERCHSVKVKRLFFWMAEKNQSPWLKKIDMERFSVESGNLGSGKRMIVRGGKYDAKYLITVPQEMIHDAYG